MGETQPFASASGYFSCRIVIPDDINALRLVVGNPAALQVVTHADWHSALFLAIGITERRHKARRDFVCFPYINRCILQAVADINNRRPKATFLEVDIRNTLVDMPICMSRQAFAQAKVSATLLRIVNKTMGSCRLRRELRRKVILQVKGKIDGFVVQLFAYGKGVLVDSFTSAIAKAFSGRVSAPG